MFKKSAYEVWTEEKEAGSIITLCKDIDDAIGGGICIGSITELVGSPGVGKTQFCLQLCVNVQIPKNLRGLEGAAIYIDTNRGFSIDRVKEIANATQAHCDQVYQRTNNAKLDTFTVDTILSNIHYSNCNSYVDLLAAIYGLRKLLQDKPHIHLIVIDSFSYLFRLIDDDLNLVQITYETFSKLQKIAVEFQCAVVITNELTTRIAPDEKTFIVPSLGESHSHRVNHQITIARDIDHPGLIVANVDKCFVKEEEKVAFQITKDGLRPFRQVFRRLEEQS